jgi:hypothetical protein
MSDPYDHHDETVILDRTDDPIVAYTILPVLAERGPTKRLAVAPRVFTALDAVSQEDEQSLSHRASDLAQLPLGRR